MVYDLIYTSKTMESLKTILILSIFFLLHAQAIIFTIRNNCPYTVWPAAVPFGGGQRLDTGQTWTLNLNSPHVNRIWARTNCSFDNSGRGSCLTGDCNGQLNCQSAGSPPRTVAEYRLNTFSIRDYYDVSVLEGFNVPMEFTPTSNGCARPVRCTADITGQCPAELRVPGGCNNPCTVHRTTEYCCGSPQCGPTDLSRFFKARCRDCFTYPEDDPTSTFTCPAGTNYRVVFCP